MLSKITRGNQVTIPKAIMKRTGLKASGDYVDIEYKNGIIYLKPVEIEERIPREVWEKFEEKALKHEKGDLTLSPQEAKNFLAKRIAKHK